MCSLRLSSWVGSRMGQKEGTSDGKGKKNGIAEERRTGKGKKWEKLKWRLLSTCLGGWASPI